MCLVHGPYKYVQTYYDVIFLSRSSCQWLVYDVITMAMFDDYVDVSYISENGSNNNEK